VSPSMPVDSVAAKGANAAFERKFGSNRARIAF
jgi:hypothetical protein